MHARYKLMEARYFLARMHEQHDNPTSFRFELSAFLGAARSALQYSLKEAQARSGGRQWYDQAIARDPLLTFFKDQRNANIHTAPVTPATVMTTHVSDYLSIDEDTIIPFQHETSSYRHRFADWSADETVIELSERYLNALEAFVDDGVAQKMITG